MLSYPVKMTFKILAIAPQIYVTDAAGTPIFYVRQQLLRLKERIDVYRDDSKSQQLFHIAADRMIDWSANYRVSDNNGNELCTIRRHGMRSLWRASYEIAVGGVSRFTVREESVFTRFMDSLIGDIAIIGMFSGYLFNPIYNINHCINGQPGAPAMKVTKRPSLLERNFWLELLDPQLDNLDQARIMLGMLMVALLERTRG